MLSEKSVKEIEKATGLTGLQEIISSQESVDITPKYTKHFNQESYDIMIENLTENVPPEKYKEAKKAGEEMPVKKIKELKGYEFEGKTVAALVDYLERKIETSKSEDVNKIKSEFEKDISEFKITISKKDKEIADLQANYEKDYINNAIHSLANTLNIDAPVFMKDEKEIDKYIQTEKEKNELYFKSKYEFKKENNKIIALQNGQILKDDLQSPLGIDELFKKHVSESFVNLKKTQGGRGEGDRTPGSNISSMKSIDELIEYAKKKNIGENTKEFDALFIEYSKNGLKNK